MRSLTPFLIATIASLTTLVGCSEEKKEIPKFAVPGTDGEPDGLVVTPPKLPSVDAVQPGAPQTSPPPIVLPGGNEIHPVTIKGKTFIPVEATFSERSWQSIVGQAGFEKMNREQRNAAVKKELERVFATVGKTTKVFGVDFVPSVGWVSAWIAADEYEALSSIKGIGRRLLVNPIVQAPIKQSEREIKRDREMGLGNLSAFAGLEDLVGLGRMGVKEFLTDATADIGSKPDGSRVTLGVVDTGITFNHPAFRDAAGKSRIDSIQDFTGEGRIFFSPDARFEAKPSEDGFTVSADFLVAPGGDVENPDPKAFTKLENAPIQVSPELKAILEAPNASGAKLGILLEEAFGKSTIDLDHNNKTNDKFLAILVPGKDNQPDAVYLAMNGGDFRKSVRLTSFEIAHETQTYFAEKIGLEIKKEVLLDGEGVEVPVTTASIVGFDPGGHGTHVTGIAAARKIIQNAPDDTELRGVAPAARIKFGRVCANTGGCWSTKAIAELSEAGASVINMSLGGLGPQNDGYGVEEAIIDRLTVQNGTVFVIAASNEGPGRQTVGSPGVSRLGISVAATASPAIIKKQYQYPGSGKAPGANEVSDDYLLYFSSRGPTAAGGMKPDIAAPGTWLSAVQLNSDPGVSSGLDVMWGTSMASPAMAGAVTLLLDGIRGYNEGHPGAQLASDAVTLRRVLLASARPFDATTFNVQTKEATRGQYTWVDEGFGMVNLQRAWKLLKDELAQRQPTAITFSDNGTTKEVPLDYQVRVLRKNPNGVAYDGSLAVAGLGDAPEAKFGRGLWFDAKARETFYSVQIARRLPATVLDREDIGELATMLKTTADEFELETTIHGSHVNWLHAGSLRDVDCAKDIPAPGSAPKRMIVVGEGARDVPVDPETGKGGSVAQETSMLNICVDRHLVDTLEPGDHGAVISAYRVIGSKREAVPSFVVPVYVTVPHKTMAGPEGLHAEGAVGSFGVARHYIDVPTGTSIVNVTLTVPPPAVQGTQVSNCSGVSLEALEGGNTLIPPEFQESPGNAIAMSCTAQGNAAPENWRTVSISRAAPKPGIWDLHVFGMYGFKSSSYKIEVSFAKVRTSVPALDGKPELLNSRFDVEVIDASYALKLSSENSGMKLFGFSHEARASVEEKKTVQVPDATGAIGRKYDEGTARVTISTGGSTGNDIDLQILECDDAELTKCAVAAESGSPTDVETASFTPTPGKLYVAAVAGYAIKAVPGDFTIKEEIFLSKAEDGKVDITTPQPKLFNVQTEFDVSKSELLKTTRYKNAGYTVEGVVDVKDDQGTTIVRVPVKIRPPTQATE